MRPTWSGAFNYTPEKDVARAPMRVDALQYKVEQLTWEFTDMTATGGRMADPLGQQDGVGAVYVRPVERFASSSWQLRCLPSGSEQQGFNAASANPSGAAIDHVPDDADNQQRDYDDNIDIERH
jgi:hypothetical protein